MAADDDTRDREPSTIGGADAAGEAPAASRSDDGDELDEREGALLDAWAPLTPPAGFADRVMAARERTLETVPVRRWPYVVGATAVIAAAGVALFIGVSGGRSRAASGDLAERGERTTAELGDRAVAVAEAGAAVSWKIDGDGDADVVQRAGDVFYRVDRGGAFVVHTPAGDVRVSGTCFRIEVADMKSKQQMILSGAVGAALAAAVVITVYEGRVVAETKSAKAEVAAGNRATLGADGTAAVTAMAREAVAATSEADALATREQLLARTQTQRSEIAKLRTQVAELEKRGGGQPGKHPVGPETEGRAVYDATPEHLAQWAKECHVRVDQPSLERFTPLKPGGRNDRGLEPSELEAYNAAMTEVAKQFRDMVRALYIEATGDTAGADTLSTDAMKREIEERSSKDEFSVLLQKISAERAGLQPPPADLGKTSPMERLLRAYLALGDQSEAALAKRLGAERARAIRGNGWDSQSRMSGCPNAAGGE